MHVHWIEQSQADVPPADDWLCESELALLSGLRFPKRRADWRLGRWSAKRAVACALQLPEDNRSLKKIVIRSAPSGEPRVTVVDEGPAVTISLSHRDGRAACALAWGAIQLGCDLELVEAKSDAFIADYFTVEEQELIAQADAGQRPLLASLLWSAKESALKALHVGLRADTRSVEVHPAAIQSADASRGEWNRLLVRCARSGDFHGWWRCAGKILRTVVATPAPSRPVEALLAVERQLSAASTLSK